MEEDEGFSIRRAIRRKSIRGGVIKPQSVISVAATEEGVGSPSKKNSLLFKIKFPPTKIPKDATQTQDSSQAFETTNYPFDFKLVCLDKNCNVTQAIICVQKTFKLPSLPSLGL